MITALLIVFLAIMAIVFFLWLVRMMMQVSCPTCLKEAESEEVIIPIIPGLRWFCPNCSNTFPHSEIKQQIKPSQ